MCVLSLSPQPLSAVPGASAGEENGSWNMEPGAGGMGGWRVWRDAEEWQERSRVVHSDPAATIKIGGVRCLHSSLCKSHQPEPWLFLAAGYIIMRSAGGGGRGRGAEVGDGVDGKRALQVVFSHPAVAYGLYKSLVGGVN